MEQLLIREERILEKSTEKSLQTLAWDERIGPRRTTMSVHFVVSHRLFQVHLPVVCPKSDGPWVRLSAGVISTEFSDGV